MKFKFLYYLFIAIIFLFSKAGRAMDFDVIYSDWYLTDDKYYTIDITLNRFIIEPGDPQVKNGVVSCSGYGCRFEVIGSYPIGSDSKYSPYIIPRGTSPVKVPLDELNQKINNILPWTAKLVFRFSAPTGLCVRLQFRDTLPSTDSLSTCDGTLPPIIPPPPVPVFCSIEELSNGGVLEFGTINSQETKVAGINANIVCTGDKNASWTGKLLFSDINVKGSKKITLRNNSDGSEIHGNLFIDNDKTSNEKKFEVRGGYTQNHLLNVELTAEQLKGNSGDFVGTALVIFEME
jgi:hypothetical protein